jgi:integrase
MRINPVTGHSEVAPLSTATVNRQTWQLIRRIHLFAGKKLKVKDLEVIDWSDFAKGRMEPVRTREITFEDEDKIALLSDRGYGAVFRFGQLSGLRWHALCTLRWSQVNFADMEITIRNKRSARSKENRSHTIPIDSAMLDLLRTEKGNHPEFVFTFEWEGADWRNPKNGTKYKGGQRYPVTPWGFRSWFERVKREAKLVDVRIHDIRRTAGGRVNRGAGLVAAQKLLGHASVATTAKHYAHHTTDEQREAQERAHSATKARRKRLLEIDSLDETSQREYQGPIKVRVPK